MWSILRKNHMVRAKMTISDQKVKAKMTSYNRMILEKIASCFLCKKNKSQGLSKSGKPKPQLSHVLS